MTKAQNHILYVLWLGNFLCLGLGLAYWTGALVAVFSPVTAQKSILLVLLFAPLCVWLGKYLWSHVESYSVAERDFVWVCSFVFPATTANFVFSPGRISFLSLAIPFLALIWAKKSIGHFSRSEDLLEGFITMLCQAAVLALVFRVSNQWALCIMAGALVCGIVYWLMGSKMWLLTATISPLMVLWFFLNLSNQLTNSYPDWSRHILMAGAAVYLGVLGLGYVFSQSRGPGLKALNRACLLFFAASFIMDINVEAGMSTPFHMLDFHWWIHVAPGLDAIYDTMQPYRHYIPFEGFIFETMLPRLWFVGLNQTMGGYFVLMGLFCFASMAVFSVLLYAMFRKILGLDRFTAGLLACVLVITNLTLLQIMYPFPGAWTIAERSVLCFVSVLLFLSFYIAGQKPWLAILTGGAHAFSFFYEPFFGLACLVALAGTMLLLFSRLKGKLALTAGVVGVITAFIIMFRIPLYMFFIHQPLAMVDSGGQIVDLSQGRHIFQAFFRDQTLSIFHYSNALGALLIFLGLIPTEARQHKFFGLALYLFIATFFMTISGGQRLFGEPGQTFSTVHFAAMASVLSIPLWICLIRIGLDVFGPAINRHILCIVCIAVAIFISFTDGIQRGLAPGPGRPGTSNHRFLATSWDEQVHYQDSYSNSIPVIVKYYHKCKSRQHVLKGPRALPIHYAPYDKWKDAILPMPPVQDIRAFLSHSRPKDMKH